MIKMPIRLLYKNNKPWAYTWGYHGAKYTLAKYGVKGARVKAAKQAQAIFAGGYRGRLK